MIAVDWAMREAIAEVNAIAPAVPPIVIDEPEPEPKPQPKNPHMEARELALRYRGYRYEESAMVWRNGGHWISAKEVWVMSTADFLAEMDPSNTAKGRP